MKRVLSLLMAFVFLQSESWALSGGPFGGQTSGARLNGTYAGVLIPEVEVVGRSASIGLFTLAKPASGLATGGITVFVNGAAFNGTITGVMDPQDGSFDGVIDATSSFQVSTIVPGANGANTTQNSPLRAQGGLKAEVERYAGTNAYATGTTVALRIAGRAVLDVFFRVDAQTGTPIISETVAYSVDGFKQVDS